MEEAEAPVEAIGHLGQAGVSGGPAVLAQSLAAREHLRRALRSPITVSAVVLALYGAWLISLFGVGNRPYDTIWVGASFLQNSQASPTINAWGGTPSSSLGYDGQFFYFLALDPVPGTRGGKLMLLDAGDLVFGAPAHAALVEVAPG